MDWFLGILAGILGLGVVGFLGLLCLATVLFFSVGAVVVRVLRGRSRYKDDMTHWR